ncbi:MAG: hypothetical protein K5685_02675 [Bacteroidales bacterium]|nr:hypothetical protein [Bacteroidales bacterium]
MESAGAVFLPAAGSRNGSVVGGIGLDGDYWSATAGDTEGAFNLDFDSRGARWSYDRRYTGLSVRLVRVLQN